MAAQRPDQRPGLEVPQLDGLVTTPGNHLLAVGSEHDRHHAVIVPPERENRALRTDIPDGKRPAASDYTPPSGVNATAFK